MVVVVTVVEIDVDVKKVVVVRVPVAEVVIADVDVAEVVVVLICGMMLTDVVVGETTYA